MADVKKVLKATWEDFDAEGLFPVSALHTNTLTKVDKKDLTKVDQDDLGEQNQQSSDSSEQGEPQDGDTYTDAQMDKNHTDQLYEMDGLEGGNTDDRDVNADKEVDERTQPEEDNQAESGNTDEGNDSPKEDGDEPDQPSGEKEKSELTDEDGADNPIQKEEEDVDEVAEATSKTSEDVHGGDEATKDIEDSSNAADDGMNEENEGAESGKDGQGGDGNDGSGEDDGEFGDEEGDGDGNGTAFSNQEDNESDGKGSGNPLAEEDWESSADHSASALQLENDLEELEAKARDESGHRTSLPSYDFDREDHPAELEIAFKKGRELIQKLAAEEDFTSRINGQVRWDAKAIVRNVVSYCHPRIPSSRYDRPREADIVMLLDISGSCAQQAEMFMAIAAGAIGHGVRIYVGYNGSCRAAEMQVPKKALRSYKQAKSWVQGEVERVSGWENQHIGEWSFEEFVEQVKPKTCIIFGDWDGIDQYQDVAHEPKHKRSTKFFWFANEGYRNREGKIPEKWTKKNYFPGVYTPRDLVKALQKLR